MVTIYSTTWCGYCIRLKRQLERQGVSFVEVDIEQNSKAETLVRSVNRGNAVVPTVEFEDGTTLTNPSLRQVLDKLEPAA